MLQTKLDVKILFQIQYNHDRLFLELSFNVLLTTLQTQIPYPVPFKLPASYKTEWDKQQTVKFNWLWSSI